MDHHHIDTVTAVTPSADFSGLHFTRSATGHVHSAFWSYPWKQYNPRGPYHIGSHFHALRERSIAAFACALGIPEHQVMVTVRENPQDGALEWRCGTQHPVVIPELLLRATMLASQDKYLGIPRTDPATTQRVIGPAIDI